MEQLHPIVIWGHKANENTGIKDAHKVQNLVKSTHPLRGKFLELTWDEETLQASSRGSLTT